MYIMKYSNFDLYLIIYNYFALSFLIANSIDKILGIVSWLFKSKIFFASSIGLILGEVTSASNDYRETFLNDSFFIISSLTLFEIK